MIKDYYNTKTNTIAIILFIRSADTSAPASEIEPQSSSFQDMSSQHVSSPHAQSQAQVVQVQSSALIIIGSFSPQKNRYVYSEPVWGLFLV